MPITRSQLGTKVSGPQQLSDSIRSGRYCLETFMAEPLCFKKGALTTPGGTSLDECLVLTGFNQFEYTFAGDATDAFLPVLASEGGYNWTMTTATLDRGVEINFGGLKDAHPLHHIPSTEDWFARILLITEDASGTDAFFGYRKVAAYAATLTEYSDVVGIRLLGDSSSTTAAVTAVTNLNNGGSTDYSSTPLVSATPLEDATAIELEVRSVGGKAFFYINGVNQPDATYTYDSGDVMTQVVRLIQTTDISSQLKTLAFECGPLADRTDLPLTAIGGSTI